MGQDRHPQYEPEDALGAEVDDDLHRALTAAYPTTYEATTAYDELRPTLVRNRLRQLVRQGATATAAVALIMLGGSLALSRFTSTESDSTVIAGPASGDSIDADESEPSDAELPVTSHADGVAQGGAPAAGGNSQPATASESNTTALPTDEPAPTSTVPEADPNDGGSAPTASPPMPSSAAPPTSEAASTTTPTTTASTAATVFESVCGSVSYTVDGRDVALVEAIAANGGEADIKSAGPEMIEVSFEGRGDHCEITIEWKNGTLVAADDHEAGHGESE